MDEAVASPGQLAADVATAEKTEANRREYWQWALLAVLLLSPSKLCWPPGEVEQPNRS